MLAPKHRNSLWSALPVVLCLSGAASASVTISTGATSNMNCAGGVCTATAPDANLNTSFLETLLAAGDAKVVTGGGATDIELVDPLAWANASRLTLQASQALTVDPEVMVQGRGGLTLSGTLAFRRGGKIDFFDTASNLKINGQTYKLVDDLTSLARQAARNASGSFALSVDQGLHKAYSTSPVPTVFAGNFDGLGHAISGLRLRNAGSNAGLFASNAGRIAHLTISGATVVGTQNAGFVAGTNTGTIDGVSAGGSEKFVTTMGAITGFNDHGTIVNSSGTIGSAKGSNTTRIGGVAATSTGTIDHSQGTVAGKQAEVIVGGLVGYADIGSVITNSSGTVGTVATSTAGGLVGINLGSVSTSFGNGTAHSFSDSGPVAGGLVGDNRGTIADCYATASAEALDTLSIGAAGGLAGVNSGTIATSYSTGTAIVQEPSMPGGGVVSWDKATNGMASDYWDMDTSNVKSPSQGALNPQNDPGITGLTDAQLKSGLPAGFDPAVWGQSASINDGYPYLLNNPPPQ